MRARQLAGSLCVMFSLIGCADAERDGLADPFALSEPGRTLDMAADLAVDAPPELDLGEDMAPDMLPDLGVDMDEDLGPDLPQENRAPVFTSAPPAGSTEWQPSRYAAVCVDPDGDAVEIRVAPDDLCNGVMRGGAYVWTPGEEHGGVGCRMSLVCSDGELETRQVALIPVEEVNDPPFVMEIMVTPIPIAYYGQTLICRYTYVDGEDDPDRSLVEWLIGGRVVGTGPTLSDYPPGAMVSCRVTPRDGMSSGRPGTSPAVRTPDLVQVAAGSRHTCATKSGALYCWGADDTGQLGDGQHMQRATPVAVPGMGSRVSAVVAAGSKTCAIRDAALYCWGTEHLTPTLVEGMDAMVSAVAVGGNHTCAIRDGALSCWGSNSDGQLGDGTGRGQQDPSPVVGMGANVSAVWAGGHHTCALKAGELWCWGSNASGQLGDGTTSDAATPRLLGAASGAALGYEFSCALRTTGLECWGRNAEWQLGAGVTTLHDELLGLPVQGMGTGVGAFWAGQRHACASKGGALSCWGENYSGQIGDNTVTGQRRSPTPVFTMVGGVTSGAAGSGHTCAVRDAALWCWGDNDYGQVGDGSDTRRFVPVRVALP
jgi:alpha-tubulin suppressor-like RCC1 family protein